MNKEAKSQYMDTLRERYLKGTKKEKGELLNEYCRNTGQERKYAIKKFNYQVRLKMKEELTPSLVSFSHVMKEKVSVLWLDDLTR